MKTLLRGYPMTTLNTQTAVAQELKPNFPIALSSSLVSAYKQCGMKFFYEYVLNKVPISESVHLIAGAAYAKGHEVFRKIYYGEGRDFDKALQAGYKALLEEYGNFEPNFTYKTWDRTAQAFLSFYDEYDPRTDFIEPAQINDKPAVEFSFAIPLPYTHPDTGDPILYAGRFDALMSTGGPLFIYDDKTTGSMGPTWAKQWDLRAQFTGYQWGAEQHGYNITGVIIRGACIQKTQTQHAQAVTTRPRWQIDRWYSDLCQVVERMLEDYNNLNFEYNLDFACTMYGGCAYKPLCEAQNPAPWLKQDYTQRTWEPILVETL